IAYSLIKAHDKARKVQSRRMDIFKIEQYDSELLWDFMIRLRKERMSLSSVLDDWYKTELESAQSDFPNYGETLVE
ncbi:hypothetical protein HAX54_016656, partial [Datura stramonium]|nr:hypothetical protein [Datura stramonium]